MFDDAAPTAPALAQALAPHGPPHPAPWEVTIARRGTVTATQDGVRLALPALAASDATRYHNAQISDFTLPQPRFLWRAPLTLTVRARADHADLRGTAGFGFWNHPMSIDLRGLPRLPQVAWWLFTSPPNAMPLAHDVPGHGWKAATLDATRPAFLALAPFAPVGTLLVRHPALERALWPLGQAALGVSERALPATLLADWHTYTLHWGARHVVFAVDGVTVHVSPHSPRGPMGFVAWVDNRWLVCTPQGRLGVGTCVVPRAQALTLAEVRVTPG